MAFLTVSNTRIIGISACVPLSFVKTEDYCLMTQEETNKFISSTGIEIRHISKNDQCASDLCYSAAERLLSDLNWNKSEIDVLIFASHSGDYKIPSTSCILQHKLGLKTDCMAFDINHGCTGFVYGMSIMANLLSTGCLKKGLLLVGNTQSKNVSIEDKSTYPIFGDAGTATALEYAADSYDTMNFNFITDGFSHQSVYIPDGGHRNPVTNDSFIVEDFGNGIKRSKLHLKMDGADVFSYACSLVPKSVNKLIEYYNINIEEIDYLIMHQANRFLCERIRKKLHIPAEKVPYNFMSYGNTSGGSIPLTMVTNLREIINKKNTEMILASIGGGFSIASARIISRKIHCSELIYL